MGSNQGAEGPLEGHVDVRPDQVGSRHLRWDVTGDKGSLTW